MGWRPGGGARVRPDRADADDEGHDAVFRGVHGATTTLPVASAQVSAGQTFYNYGSTPLRVSILGPFTFPTNGGQRGSTAFTMQLPACTGSRPTHGPIYANFPYVYDSGGNTVSFRYLIGEWSY
jgi:hypothetical protein